MTTFTSDDREEEYKKILAAAPFQPGYEDAVPIPFAGWVNASPPHIVDSGASVNKEYERGFIDGMAKMTESAVHRAVEGMGKERSLAEEITEGFNALETIRQQHAEIEALKMGFANSGTNDSNLAETRAMANRFYLQKQELELEKKDMNEKYQQQQAEISLLQEYVCQLESGLDSSINLNKAQAERNNKNET